MLSLLLRSTFLFSLSFLFMSYSYAEKIEQTSQLIRLDLSREDVDSVRIEMIPIDVFLHKNLHEPDLAKIACVFESKNKRQIDALLNNLRNVKIVNEQVRLPLLLRYSLSINFTNHENVKFLLGSIQNGYAPGTRFDVTKNETQSFKINKSFIEELENWGKDEKIEYSTLNRGRFKCDNVNFTRK